ncbi:uroporphyrinogen-III C-methyltransferase [Paludibacterium denitrificans]|uniref:uroporphyrinogen-III C-methyltransferase n=1 Tax=Paludibacterium denitrificans TaxID=2675226 RepID=UPI001E3B7672|nr:uroporphyrinogen-III C-methyltransferase [Paludibacterium denitrificans]
MTSAKALGELVHIRRLDKPEALLLSPEQAFFLRENLKMRLLDARLALIQRDGTTFAADIDAAQRYAQRYFDSNA